MKLKKILLTTILLSVLLCLFCGMNVFAETHSGEITNYMGNKLFWEVDTEARTLTFSGYGGAFPPEEPVAWAEWEDSIDEIVLLGESIFSSAGMGTAYQNSFRRIDPEVITSLWDDGFSWVYDRVTKKLTYYGQGKTEGGGWHLLSLGIDVPVDTMELTSGFVWGNITRGFHPKKLIVSESVAPSDPTWDWHKTFADYVEINAANPLYCSYDGAVYSKDGSTLYYASRGDVKFHPNLRCLERYSLRSSGETVVLPWGLSSIETYGLAQVEGSTVILPDTLTSVGRTQISDDRRSENTVVRYSRNNTAAKENLKTQSNGYRDLVVEIVDSVAEYYPGQITPPQGPGDGEPSGPSMPGSPGGPGESSSPTKLTGTVESSGPSGPTESSRPAESKPESPKPAESKPAESKPAASSTPTGSTPQSKPQPESAAPIESSAPAEESKPAESESVPESVTESVDVSENSEAPSSEAAASSEESSQPDPEDQETGGRSGATIPLTIALCAALTAVGVLLFLLLRKKEK